MARKPAAPAPEPTIRVRRIHRRDLNRVWEFLKRVFRSVNRETVEYQRPRTKTRFLEIYEEEGIEQLLFEYHQGERPVIVGYAECAYEVIGSDNWINERYFENRDMRPLFVEEIAISPDYQGRGIGSFVIEQLEHLARVRGCTHLVLEVAANNKRALQFYRARSFSQLDAAIFLAKKVVSAPELLPPRALPERREDGSEATGPEGQVPSDMPEAPAVDEDDGDEDDDDAREPEADVSSPSPRPARARAPRRAAEPGWVEPARRTRGARDVAGAPEPAAPAPARARASRKPAEPAAPRASRPRAGLTTAEPTTAKPVRARAPQRAAEPESSPAKARARAPQRAAKPAPEPAARPVRARTPQPAAKPQPAATAARARRPRTK